MEIFIIISLVVLIIIITLGIIILIVKKKIPIEQFDNSNRLQIDLIKQLNDNNNKIIEDITKFKQEVSKNLSQEVLILNENITRQIEQRFITSNQSLEGLNQRINSNILNLNKQVEERLTQGFDKTNVTFNNIIEQMTKITETQTQLDKLNESVINFSNILTDKKARGIFGETQLKQILVNVYGEGNKLYELQKKLTNGTIVDATINAPEPLGMISIDSKFPYENYNRLIDSKITEVEKQTINKSFKTNIKKHIDDIASKYIISGQTAPQAIMFIPAEAIFAEIFTNFEELVTYAQTKSVWITSPSNLIYLLTTVQVMIREVEYDKNIEVVKNQIKKLFTELERFNDRWQGLKKGINLVIKSAKDVEITTNKIIKGYQDIYDTNFELIAASEKIENFDNQE